MAAGRGHRVRPMLVPERHAVARRGRSRAALAPKAAADRAAPLAACGTRLPEQDARFVDRETLGVPPIDHVDNGQG